jgi:hypothetical protein
MACWSEWNYLNFKTMNEVQIKFYNYKVTANTLLSIIISLPFITIFIFHSALTFVVEIALNRLWMKERLDGLISLCFIYIISYCFIEKPPKTDKTSWIKHVSGQGALSLHTSYFTYSGILILFTKTGFFCKLGSIL